MPINAAAMTEELQALLETLDGYDAMEAAMRLRALCDLSLNLGTDGLLRLAAHSEAVAEANIIRLAA